MRDGFRPHEAPHVGDIAEMIPRVGVPQVLGVLGFPHFYLHDIFASSDQPQFRGEEERVYSFVAFLSRFTRKR